MRHAGNNKYIMMVKEYERGNGAQITMRSLAKYIIWHFFEMINIAPGGVLRQIESQRTTTICEL